MSAPSPRAPLTEMNVLAASEGQAGTSSSGMPVRPSLAGRKRKQSVLSRRASTSSVLSTGSLDAFLSKGRRSSVAGGGGPIGRKSRRLTADAADFDSLLGDLESIGGSDGEGEDDTNSMRMTIGGGGGDRGRAYANASGEEEEDEEDGFDSVGDLGGAKQRASVVGRASMPNAGRRRDTLDLIGGDNSATGDVRMSAGAAARRDTMDMLGILAEDDNSSEDESVDTSLENEKSGGDSIHRTSTGGELEGSSGSLLGRFEAQFESDSGRISSSSDLSGEVSFNPNRSSLGGEAGLDISSASSSSESMDSASRRKNDRRNTLDLLDSKTGLLSPSAISDTSSTMSRDDTRDESLGDMMVADKSPEHSGSLPQASSQVGEGHGSAGDESSAKPGESLALFRDQYSGSSLESPSSYQGSASSRDAVRSGKSGEHNRDKGTPNPSSSQTPSPVSSMLPPPSLTLSGQKIVRSALRNPPLKSAMKKGKYSVHRQSMLPGSIRGAANRLRENEGNPSSKSVSASSRKRGGNRRFSSAAILTSQEASGRKAAGKTVVFGSPAVAEFDLKMPPTSMRKLPADDAKRMFSMEPRHPPNEGIDSDSSEEMDELTKVNASVLAEVESMLDSDSEDETRKSSSSRRGSRGRPSSANSKRRSLGGRRNGLAADDDHTMLLNDSMALDSSDDDLQPHATSANDSDNSEVSFNQNSSYLGSEDDGKDDEDASDDGTDMSMTDNLPRELLLSSNKKRPGEHPFTEESTKKRRLVNADISGPISSVASAAAGYDAENDPDEHTVDLGSLGDLLGSQQDDGDATGVEVSASKRQNMYNQDQKRRSSSSGSAGNEEVTVELEGGIGSLLETVEEGDTSMSGASVSDGSSRTSIEDGAGSSMNASFDSGSGSVDKSVLSDDGRADYSRDETQTMELEGGIGSLLENLDGQEEDDTGVLSGASKSDVSASQSPSSDYSDNNQKNHSGQGRGTPSPAVFTVTSIADQLELGDVFSKVKGEMDSEDYTNKNEEHLIHILDKDEAHKGNEENSQNTALGENSLIEERKEAMRKTIMILRERTAELHDTLSSGKFRLAIQKLGQKLNASQTTEDNDSLIAEVRRNAAVFVEVGKLEAHADFCRQACELERLTLEKLKQSLAALIFDGKTIDASYEEIEELSDSAREEIAAMDSVLSLHTELHEQEKVLAMYVAQRDEVLAEKQRQEDSLSSLRSEEALLQASISDRRSAESRRTALLARVQALQEMNDLLVGHLSSFKVELLPMLPSGGGKAHLVYTHTDGGQHIVTINFAAKAQAIICKLHYLRTNRVLAGDRKLISQLVNVFGSHWRTNIEACKSMPALQRAMQDMDLEMGRMHALHNDLEQVLKKFVVPGSVKVCQPDHENDNSEPAGDPKGMESICSFTVSFSSLSPASKWSVKLSVMRGYPFGWVKIEPESEFGAKPVDVTGITDVAFGYGRLLRACEYLENIFKNECARLRKESGEE